MVAMIVTGGLGTWLGEAALDRTSEKRYRRVLKLFLTTLAVELLIRAAGQAGWW